MKLKIAYFGTPDFSADFLKKIILDKDLPIEVGLVVTQPDRPVGRRQIPTPSPVKVMAEKYNIPILTGVESGGLPTARTRHFAGSTGGRSERQAPSLNDVRLALLFAYGAIIPKRILDLPRLGFWNIHPSLLPKYRGASPIAYPLMLGDKKTGVTLMQMDEVLDHGPIIAQEELTIQPDGRRPDLTTKLTSLAFEIFKKVLELQLALLNDLGGSQFVNRDEHAHGNEKRDSKVPVVDQKHNLATYTRRLTKQDGYIPLEVLNGATGHELRAMNYLPPIIADYFQKNHQSTDSRLPTPVLLYNLFRALYPWPGLWTFVNLNGQKTRLKILDLGFDEKLTIKTVQLEGKKPVDFTTFQKAYPNLLI